MKRIALITLTALALQSNAQSLVNKKGQNVLPEKGNWAIGIDVVPILKHAGNLLYSSSDSSSDFSPYFPLTIFAKYVNDDNSALRLQFKTNFNSSTQDTLVPKASSTNPNELVSDESKRTTLDVVLGVGKEWRKGTGRVTGIYGVEGVISLATDKTKYTYGNELDVTIQSNFQRVSVKQGPEFGLGIRGFLGVEYFIGAKIGLTAEYGWGPSVTARGRGAIEDKVVDGNSTKSQITETSKSFNFGFNNDLNSGTIALNFYF